MKRNRIISIIASIVILIGVTACGSEKENTQGYSERNIIQEDLEEVDTDSEKENNADSEILFRRNIYKAIPEGYEYCKGHEYANWNKLGDTVKIDMPEDLELDYSKIRSLTTDMYGIVDYEGNILIDVEYSSLLYENTIDDIPIFYVEYENKCGYIDIYGNVTVPFWEDNMVVQKGVSQNGDFLLINEQNGQIEICNIKNGKLKEFNLSDYGADSNDSISISENGIIRIGEKCMLDLNCNVIREENSFSIWEGNSIGYAIMEDYKSDYDKYIINSKGEIVSGPYDYIRNVDNLYIVKNDAKYIKCYNSLNNQEYILCENEKLSPDFMLVSEATPGIKVNTNGVAYVTYNEANGSEFNLNIVDFETGEKRIIYKGCPSNIEICGIYGDKVVYGYDGVQKIIDFEGNIVNETRYYGFQDIGCGALLKNDDGTWIRINSNGQFVEDNKVFFGIDTPDTYGDLPILCFRIYNGQPCVVVEEIGQQVAYAL